MSSEALRATGFMLAGTYVFGFVSAWTGLGWPLRHDADEGVRRFARFGFPFAVLGILLMLASFLL